MSRSDNNVVILFFLFLILKEISNLFSIDAEPIYITIDCV